MAIATLSDSRDIQFCTGTYVHRVQKYYSCRSGQNGRYVFSAAADVSADAVVGCDGERT